MATGFVQIRGDFLGGGRVVTALPRPPSWWGGGPLRCPSPKTPPPASTLQATSPVCPQLWNSGYATGTWLWLVPRWLTHRHTHSFWPVILLAQPAVLSVNVTSWSIVACNELVDSTSSFLTVPHTCTAKLKFCLNFKRMLIYNNRELIACKTEIS